MTDPTIFLRRMEKVGETEMRRQLSNGDVPADEIESVQIWLGMKDAQREAANEVAVRAAHDQARAAKWGNLISVAALIVSLIALVVALRAR